MFGFFFFKLFMKIVFENTENVILVFSENCHCSLHLVFYMFFVFSIIKKSNNLFFMFSYCPCFSGQKTIFKNYNQTGTNLSTIFDHILIKIFIVFL